jgi:hypothetical protein
MKSHTNHLGRTCLDRVEERDIDLLLLEELICEQGMRDLLAQLVLGETNDAAFLEVSNSISTASDGESDLIAIYALGDRRLAVMIENKISASFMPEQALRYRRRGEQGIREGYWDSYLTVLVAPKRYLDAEHGDHVFDRHIAYEALKPHFERENAGPRGIWRAALLDQAIGGSRKSVYKRIVDDATTRFFHDYFDIAAREYPDLRMKRDRDRPAGSTWVQFHPAISMPKNFTLYHKAAEIFTADISLARTRVEDLHTAIGPFLEEGMSVEQTNKSAVIRIHVPALAIADGVQAQIAEVRTGLAAATRLRAFYIQHKPKLDMVSQG